MESYFLTDTGRVREHNEDSVTILKNINGEYLLAVADGMGGVSEGEMASRSVKAAFLNWFEDGLPALLKSDTFEEDLKFEAAVMLAYGDE